MAPDTARARNGNPGPAQPDTADDIVTAHADALHRPILDAGHAVGPVLALLPWRRAGWLAMSSEKLYTASDLLRCYALGAQDERARVEHSAGVEHEHAQAWARLGEQAREARRQQLLRLFRACAEDFAERSGRAYVEYRGGPVVWP